MPTDELAPNLVNLSHMTRSTSALVSTTQSLNSIESLTSAPSSTTTPGDNTEFMTVPLTTQPADISELSTLALRPYLAAGRSARRSPASTLVRICQRPREMGPSCFNRSIFASQY